MTMVEAGSWGYLNYLSNFVIKTVISDPFEESFVFLMIQYLFYFLMN